jgi:4-hydroxybenzoate polyprenyltransferase
MDTYKKRRRQKMNPFTTIKKLILVSRPISWINTAYPFAVAYMVAGGEDRIFLIIGTLFFLIPYNLLMYGINDVFDYDSDIKNPRKGGVEGMRESRALHPAIIIASIILSTPPLLFLILKSNLAGSVALAGCIFFVVAYSVAWLRFKERPVLDSITSSSHFVGPMVVGLLCAGWSNQFTPYVLAFFLWGMASHAFGAVQDIIPDRKGNIASIATIFGAKTTVRLAFSFYALSSIILLLDSYKALPVALVAFLYCINIVPFINVTDKQSAQTNVSWRRFLWLNYATGTVITLTLLVNLVL